VVLTPSKLCYIWTALGWSCDMQSIECYSVEMNLLSAIKWTLMDKAKFGLHSLNAEKKMLSQNSTAWYCMFPQQVDRWSRDM